MSLMGRELSERHVDFNLLSKTEKYDKFGEGNVYFCLFCLW